MYVVKSGVLKNRCRLGVKKGRGKSGPNNWEKGGVVWDNGEGENNNRTQFYSQPEKNS